MRIIVFRYLQLLAILTLGALLGAAVINLQIGKKIDALHQLNSELSSELSDKNITIGELEKNLKNLQGKKQIVKKINIHVNMEKEDEFVQLELEKKVKEMLAPIIGREIEELDPLSIPDIVNKRRVLVDDDEYLLTVKTTLISEEVVMYIDAKRQIPPANTPVTLADINHRQ